MKTKERLIDLSDIKDDELDKTASFTDLMSRSERRKREKEKKKKNIDEINIEDAKIEKKDNKEKDLNNNFDINNISEIESTEKILEETKQYEDLTKTIDKDLNIKDNDLSYDDDNLDDDKKYGSGLIIVMGLFLLISTGIFLYSILFTNNLDKNKLIIIDSIIISSMYFIFSLSIIGGKKFSKCLSIFNYLIFIAYIAFNTLIALNYIK